MLHMASTLPHGVVPPDPIQVYGVLVSNAISPPPKLCGEFFYLWEERLRLG
jgi:hypothetical protein